MSGKRLRPPPSTWSRWIKNVEHPGVQHPNLWEIWLKTLDVLKDTAGPEAKQAAKALEAMLQEPLASENLVGALLNYETLASDPISGARARRGDTKRLAERARIHRVREDLSKLANKILALGDELTLSGIAIEHLDNAPTGTETRSVAHAAWLGINQLYNHAGKLEKAAPKARGRQPKPEVRARLNLIASVFRSYQAAGNKEPDEAFWALFRELWAALTGEFNLPDEQRLREHLRDKFAVGQD